MSIEHYLNAIDAILKRGEKVTLDAIRQEAGGGSYSTIITARRLWLARGMTTSVQEIVVPPVLVSTMEELWRNACSLAESLLAAERAALAATRAELEQSSVELCTTADSLAEKVVRLKTELGALVTERNTLRLALDRMTLERDTYAGMVKETLTGMRGSLTRPIAQENDLPF